MVATAIYSCYHGVVERYRISSLQSHGKALEKECLPGVSPDCGYVPANLLCELNGHLMPCTSCFYNKWVEDVCAGQFGVFVYLVLCCFLGCCTLFSCCATKCGTQHMCLVLSCPRPLAFLWPMAGEWSYLGVCCHPASGWWLFNCWHLGSLIIIIIKHHLMCHVFVCHKDDEPNHLSASFPGQSG